MNDLPSLENEQYWLALSTDSGQSSDRLMMPVMAAPGGVRFNLKTLLDAVSEQNGLASLRDSDITLQIRQPEVIPFANNSLEYIPSERAIRSADQIKELAPQEGVLMDTLAGNVGRVVRRHDLLSLWSSHDALATEGTLRTHVFRLRRAIDAVSTYDPADVITTVRHLGYRLETTL